MRYMKIVSVVLLVVSVAFSVRGEEDPIRVSWSASAVSHYVNYLGYHCSDSPTVQNELAIVSGYARAAVLWSVGTDDRILSSNKADQIDGSVRYQMQYGPYSIVPEVLYQNYFSLGTSRADVFIPRLTAFRAYVCCGGKVTATLQIEDRFSMPTFDRRRTATFGINDAFKLNHGVAWTISAGVIADSGSKKADSGLIMQWKTAASFALTERTSVQVFMRYFDPIGRMGAHDGRKEEFVYGLGIAISF